MSYAVVYFNSEDVERERAAKSLVLKIHETVTGFPRDIIRSSGFSQYYLGQEADRYDCLGSSASDTSNSYRPPTVNCSTSPEYSCLM